MSPPPTLSLDAYKCCWRRGRFLRTLTLSEGQITTMDPVWGQVTRRMLVSDLVDYALTERAGSFDISLSFRTLGWCGGTVATLQVSSTHWLEVHRHPIRRPSHLAHSAISRIALRQTLKRGGRRYQTLSAAPTSPFSRFSTEPHSLPAAFPSLTCSPRLTGAHGKPLLTRRGCDAGCRGALPSHSGRSDDDAFLVQPDTAARHGARS